RFKGEWLPNAVGNAKKENGPAGKNLGVTWLAGYQEAVNKMNEIVNPVGGINMSDENLIINIKVDGAGMPLPARFQDPAMATIQGLSPIIREIAPITPAAVPALSELLQPAGTTAG
ncbi:MAG: hypothetical protein HQL18_03250, partial [Candidatus Omnitrophica bacterium]|nr:hypothetical protein [Candidatus Omnitrophota bacterium]